MTRRRVIRFVAVAVAALLAVAIAVTCVLAVTYVRRPFPQHDGDLQLDGLSGDVSVLRDDQGVPQIYANTSADLFRAQGFVHAQDRFFEMDLRRHISAGRLAELVGDKGDALESDEVVRTLGWRRVAEQELPLLDPQTRAGLDAYADGVNAYLRGRTPSEVSVSYSVLGLTLPEQRIEAWTALDSLTWLKAVAWDLRANYEDELDRARTLEKVTSVKKVNQLFPSYDYAKHAPIVTSPTATATAAPASSGTARKPGAGEQVVRAFLEQPAQQAFEGAGRAMDVVPAMLGEGSGTGSNSWVVSGALTSTGKPMLANDPHLATSAPGVWVQGGLHCREISDACPYDVAGYTFSGLPGIVVGHNRDVSWGLTNLGADVTDFYLEKVTGDTVLRDGKQEAITTRKEVVKVAEGDPVTVTVRSTRHGPIVSDVLDGVREAGRVSSIDAAKAPDWPAAGEDGYAVSLAWTALTPGRSMDAILSLDRAGDLKDFRAAAALLDAPAQNLVYADTEGHIAYQAPGRIPIRKATTAESVVPTDGTWPQPGWLGENDWDGFVPFASLPRTEDPSEGFIVAANQPVTAPGAGPRLTSDYDYGYRSERIRTLLEQITSAGRKVTMEDMGRIQNDTYSGIAAALVPMLRKTEVDAFTQQAVDLLDGWDLTQPADSSAAAYFNVVWSEILELTFADELPEGYRPDGGDRWFAAVTELIKDPTDKWWDDNRTPDVVETRDEVIRRSLVQARLELTSTLGKDPSRWQWGRLHSVALDQVPLGGEGTPGLVRRLVDLGPYAAPGGSSVVDAMGWDASSGNFHVVTAPSMRMIVDLSNLDSSRWVNQTGSSGHPGDDHYADQVGHWLKGETYTWPFSETAVREASDDELQLKPKTSGN